MSHLSAVLIVRNESLRIQKCLEALSFADEIVVLDTGSEDDTCQKVLGCKTDKGEPAKLFYQEAKDWKGYGAARVAAESYASCEWVIQVDADEYLTQALQDEIKKIVQNNQPMNAYMMPRTLRFFLGDLRFGGTYPDYVSRLYRPLDGSSYSEKHLVHEPLVLGKGVSLLKLKNPVIHDSYLSVSHFFEKQVYYARLWSAQRRTSDKPRRFYIWDPITHALHYFILRYFFRLGFLDGRAGFFWFASNACFTFLKYMQAYIEQKEGASKTQYKRPCE